MVTLILVAGAIILVAALVVLGSVFWKYSGDRVITCPENERPAGVKVDAGHASLSVLGGKADLRLKSCSRWPERQDCGQQCLRQIEASPEGCLVRHILTQWYEGKNCAVCGKPIGEIHWVERKPALLSPERATVEWQDVPAEKVPEVLESHQPVCFNCHLVNSMVTQHPELVLDRGRHV